MNRIFLALLALFAGIVAPVAPAHARMNGTGSAEIGAVERIETAARVCTATIAATEQPSCRIVRREKSANRSRGVRSRVYIPSVYFGVDRALE
ncbi:hypothetical protein [Novosphingobium sp.]|uniref:hypothetical protein n=1 Tax=Novosphingobium sp. TaxID=1874826 RepID=UPI002600C705|nr:hypothetical protein [Novosphingobium sp.]